MARKSKNRNISKRTLIVCGAEKTEPLYFNDFRRHLQTCGIIIEGLEVINTQTKNQLPSKLFEYALEKSIEFDFDIESGDSVWCVFDYDEFGQNILKSMELKKYEKIHKIVSTRCFELWYLLHYKYSTAFIQNTDGLEKQLSKYMKCKYEKNKSYFKELFDKQEEAIKNAKELVIFHESNGVRPYSQEHNPYTDVFKLVEYLNTLKR